MGFLMVDLIGDVDILKWISAVVIMVMISATILACVVPRETKYSSGVCVRKKEDDDRQQRRRGVYAIFQNIGDLIRDRRASDSARMRITHGPAEGEIDTSPDWLEQNRTSASVRALAGSLRWRGRRDDRRRGEYREVPLEPPSCLGFKYGAPDGVRKPQLPAIFEPPEVSGADASYGATYKLPAPAVIGVNEDP